MFGKEYSYVAVTSDSVIVVTGRGNKRFPVRLKTEASAPCKASRIWLRAELLPGDVCQYSWSTDGKDFAPLGPPCRVTPGVWVGAKVGLFCITPSLVPTTSHADFDWFEIE